MDFSQETIQGFIDTYAIEWGVNIITALAVFVIGKWIAKGLVNVAKKAMVKSKLDETLISFLGNVLYGLVFTFVIIASLSQLGVQTTSLAAILAAAGLAIGLSLQSSLSNLAAGVMIITFRPFKKGDFVETAGVAGTVDEVNIFTTHMSTPDNKAIIVPNGKILGDNIINYSAKAIRRIDFVFGVSYSDDLQKVKAVLTSIIKSDERILQDPQPVIAVSELADSSVNFVVRPWVKSADYWAVLWDVTEAVKVRFDQEGISIPFPQQDMHMHQVDKKPSKKMA